jgi:nucleoside-diphosphate-sugar epimerase
MRSDYRKPLNLGTDELVTVDELAKIVIGVSEKEIELVHDLSKPQGVRGRNSDNTRLRAVLQWEPQMTLRKGIAPTYHWIAAHMAAAASVEMGIPGAAVAAE